MAIIYLSLGSNLGEKRMNLEHALVALRQEVGELLLESTILQTEPWGNLDQDYFLNMAVKMQTELQPADLLKTVKKIEVDLGRVPAEKWGPRKIDIDILLYDDLIVDTDDLKIPHPYMLERDFVLNPLAEIDPDLVKKLLNNL